MRTAAVLILLLAFGAAKLNFEEQLAAQHRAEFFRGAHLGLDLREQVGQLGFIAALSGFRAIVADMLWIEAHQAWERTEWGRMELLFNNVTALQPRAMMFWEMAAWHMGWNASLAARENPKQPRETLRIKAQREYFELAKDFLVRGIKNNPDRYLLYDRLGMLYRDKFLDHGAASEQFEKASHFPNSPVYEKRFAAYELSYCTEHKRAAYERLRELYLRGEEERLPTLLTRLRALQEELHVPIEERVYNPPK
jgi:hypothetical protein